MREPFTSESCIFASSSDPRAAGRSNIRASTKVPKTFMRSTLLEFDLNAKTVPDILTILGDSVEGRSPAVQVKIWNERTHCALIADCFQTSLLGIAPDVN